MINNKRKYCLDYAFSMWEEQQEKQGVSYIINDIYVHKYKHSYGHGKDWVGEEVIIFNWEQYLSKWSKYSNTCVCVVCVCTHYRHNTLNSSICNKQWSSFSKFIKC